jgi:hypothetical protein
MLEWAKIFFFKKGPEAQKIKAKIYKITSNQSASA